MISGTETVVLNTKAKERIANLILKEYFRQHYIEDWHFRNLNKVKRNEEYGRLIREGYFRMDSFCAEHITICHGSPGLSDPEGATFDEYHQYVSNEAIHAQPLNDIPVSLRQAPKLRTQLRKLLKVDWSYLPIDYLVYRPQFRSFSMPDEARGGRYPVASFAAATDNDFSFMELKYSSSGKRTPNKRQRLFLKAVADRGLNAEIAVVTFNGFEAGIKIRNMLSV